MDAITDESAPKRGKGRPRWAPTQDQRNRIEFMAASGIRHELIARIEKVAYSTLRRTCKDELEFGLTKANVTAAKVCFDNVRAGEAWAVCFWLKTRGGWRETATLEHIGKDGGPIQHEGARERNIDVIEQLSARLAGAAPGAVAKRTESGCLPEAEPSSGA